MLYIFVNGFIGRTQQLAVSFFYTGQGLTQTCTPLKVTA